MGAQLVGYILPKHQSLVSLGSRSTVVSSIANCDSDSDGQLAPLSSAS